MVKVIFVYIVVARVREPGITREALLLLMNYNNILLLQHPVQGGAIWKSMLGKLVVNPEGDIVTNFF